MSASTHPDLADWLEGRATVEAVRRELKKNQQTAAAGEVVDVEAVFWKTVDTSTKAGLKGRVTPAVNTMRRTGIEQITAFKIPLRVFEKPIIAYRAALEFSADEARCFELDSTAKGYGTRGTKLYEVAPALLRWFLDLHHEMMVAEHAENHPIRFTAAEFGGGGANDPAGPVTSIGCVFIQAR